jgi:GTPase SAR1 family protein
MKQKGVPPALGMPSSITLVVHGDSSSAKSQLVVSYVQGRTVELLYGEIGDPIIEDSYLKQVERYGHPWTLEIIDTSESSQFERMNQLYWGSAHGIMFTFSVSQPTSLQYAVELCESMLKHFKSMERPPPVFCFVATRVHLEKENERRVSRDEAKVVTERFKCPYIEVSSKHFINVDESFDLLLCEVLRRSLGPKNCMRAMLSILALKKRKISLIASLPRDLVRLLVEYIAHSRFSSKWAIHNPNNGRHERSRCLLM